MRRMMIKSWESLTKSVAERSRAEKKIRSREAAGFRGRFFHGDVYKRPSILYAESGDQIMRKLFFRPAARLGLLFWMAVMALSCNHGRPCIQPKVFLDIINHGGLGEPYGATDINAVTGNRGLTVALNQEGTVTVFKWPNPSYYDQLKFMTTTRDQPRMGALPNEGLMSGIYYETETEKGFFWLRDGERFQDYLSERSVVVLNFFKERRLGLHILQSDFVLPNQDLLWREYVVVKLSESKVKKVRLVAYFHFSPQVSKLPWLPIRDWCLDELGSSTLEWQMDHDLFLQFKTGHDVSTHKPFAVYLAFGFDRLSLSHQAGPDGSCAQPRGLGKPDVFKLAQNGDFPASDTARGQVNAAIIRELEFTPSSAPSRVLSSARASVLIAVGNEKEDTIRAVEEARVRGWRYAQAKTNEFWKDLLKKVPLPATDSGRIRVVALRSVLLILLGSSKDTGAGVASISTQPPYGLDWPRDGAFTNQALLAAGFPELVKKRNQFWAKVQDQPGHRIPLVPSGNWAANYYADGVPGFPLVWWEIDETGWALWSLVSYYQATGDRAYIEEVYPAITRAADFLTRFKDPRTGRPRPAREDDNPYPRQTLHGAAAVYLGLNYAVKAAEAMEDNAHRVKWGARLSELRAAILDQFYDPACGRFVNNAKDQGKCETGAAGNDAGLLLWPAEMLEPADPRAEPAAEQCWKDLEKSFSGERKSGLYEPLGLYYLAHFWKDRPEKMDRVKRGLDWTAHAPITPTGLLGEVWTTTSAGKVIPTQGQPQLWHHALFYLAALEAWGEK